MSDFHRHAELIAEEVANGLRRLPLWLHRWVLTHLVEPRPIVLHIDPHGRAQDTFWLVTDHSGSDDAPCRVVFDGSQFGLAVTLPNGLDCFAGPIGSFADAVQSL